MGAVGGPAGAVCLLAFLALGFLVVHEFIHVSGAAGSERCAICRVGTSATPAARADAGSENPLVPVVRIGARDRQPASSDSLDAPSVRAPPAPAFAA